MASPELAKKENPDFTLPALIGRAGKLAAMRFLEFFTVNIRNRNTRTAYARAAGDFLRWCEGQNIGNSSGKCPRPRSNNMPCHHKLEEYLDSYIEPAAIAGDRKGPLFRSAIGKTAQLSGRPMLRGDVWRMVRRRASDAGIETAIGCHTFRATGITDYLTNGGRIEVARTHGRALEC